MNADFPRLITLLRKEKGISQKQAAAEFGISQALLSHYEKGIRECGLDFLVKCARFYGVSCDYLLGRSAERNGMMLSAEDLPNPEKMKDNVYHGSVLPTMYKKLIENSLDILFDRLDQCRDKRVVTSVSNYLMLAVYRMFRRLYQAAPGNVASMFRVTPARWERDADAAMFLQEGELSATMAGENGACPDPAAFEMNTETLARDYPRHATSLMNLIKNSEEVIRKHNA